MKISNKKKYVLVTGGGGYVGSVLIKDLLNRGYKVRLFDKFIFGLDSIKDLINNQNLQVVIGDIRKIEDLNTVIKNDVDSVIHLAGIVGDPACAVQASVAIETNFVSTIRLVQMCKKYSNINKFIFASTCSVYGNGSESFLDEKSNLNPVSLYAETKTDAEKEVMNILDKGHAPVILRFGTLYGLSPRMRFDLVVNFLTKVALKDKEIKIFGGNQWRPFIHVSDVSRAIQTVLESENSVVSGDIFNVGSNEENYKMKDVGKIINDCIPNIKINIIKEIKDKRSYHVSFDKIKKTLGFDVSKKIRDGVLEIRNAIQNKKIINPEDPKYFNYHVQKSD